MTAPHRAHSTHPPHERRPIRIDPLPRPEGGSRLLARLDSADARRYAVAVGPTVPLIERALGRGVLANRTVSTPEGLALEDWWTARVRFRHVVRSNLPGSRSVFVGDVRDCYGSIRPATVLSSLRELGVAASEAHGVSAVLEGLERRGVAGLPIGPWGSAVLANAVLHQVDRAFAAAGLSAMWWVDDVAVFARDPAEARRARDTFHRALARLGLVANEAKTLVLDPDAARTRLIGRTSLSNATARGMIRPP
jgi:hypothetical protein